MSALRSLNRLRNRLASSNVETRPRGRNEGGLLGLPDAARAADQHAIDWRDAIQERYPNARIGPAPDDAQVPVDDGEGREDEPPESEGHFRIADHKLDCLPDHKSGDPIVRIRWAVGASRKTLPKPCSSLRRTIPHTSTQSS